MLVFFFRSRFFCPYSIMPYKQKKRAYKRRKPRAKNNMLVVNKVLSGQDRQLYSYITGPYSTKRSRLLKLRYHTFANIQVPGVPGNIGTVVWRCQDPADPQDALGGHAAMGYNQVTAAFSKWTVISSRIKVSLSNTTGGPIVIGIAQLNNNSTALGLDGIVEQKRSKNIWFGSTEQTKSIVSNFSTRGFHGLNRGHDLVGDAEYSGTKSGDKPESRAYFHIFASPAATQTSVALPIQVELEYDVIFTDPIDLAIST